MSPGTRTRAHTCTGSRDVNDLPLVATMAQCTARHAGGSRSECCNVNLIEAEIEHTHARWQPFDSNHPKLDWREEVSALFAKSLVRIFVYGFSDPGQPLVVSTATSGLTTHTIRITFSCSRWQRHRRCFYGNCLLLSMAANTPFTGTGPAPFFPQGHLSTPNNITKGALLSTKLPWFLAWVWWSDWDGAPSDHRCCQNVCACVCACTLGIHLHVSTHQMMENKLKMRCIFFFFWQTHSARI